MNRRKRINVLHKQGGGGGGRGARNKHGNIAQLNGVSHKFGGKSNRLYL